jgi:hypothetical protein
MWERPQDGFHWEYKYNSWWLVPNGERIELVPVLRGKRDVLTDIVAVAHQPSRDAIHRFAGRYGWAGSVKRTGRFWTYVLADGHEVRLRATGQRKTAASPLVWYGDDPAALKDCRDMELRELEENRWANQMRAESLEEWWELIRGIGHLWDTWEAVWALNHVDQVTERRAHDSRKLLTDRLRWSPDGNVHYDARVAVPIEIGDIYSEAELTLEQIEKHARCHRCGGDARTHEHVAGIVAVGHETDPPSPGAYENAARRYVIEQVHKGLEGQLDLVATALGVRVMPVTLGGAIYLRFLEQTTGRAFEQRPCVECGGLFAAGRRDRRYCSKSCRDRAYYRETGFRAKTRLGLGQTSVRRRSPESIP